jgi:hypothetical protein
MKRSVTYCFIVCLAILGISCKQASDLKAFTEASYSLQQVQDVQVNGVDLMDKKDPNDFTTKEGDSLLTAISDKTLRAGATLYLNVQMEKPEEIRSMTVTQLKWQLLVDGREALKGTVAEPVVLHNGVNTLPVHTSVLLAEVEGIPNYEGLSRIMTLLGKREDLRRNLTLQIKPTVQTPVGEVELPEYITVAEPGNK